MNILINQKKKQCPPHGNIKNVNCFSVFALLRAKLICVDNMYATEQFLAVTCLHCSERKRSYLQLPLTSVLPAHLPLTISEAQSVMWVIEKLLRSVCTCGGKQVKAVVLAPLHFPRHGK